MGSLKIWYFTNDFDLVVCHRIFHCYMLNIFHTLIFNYLVQLSNQVTEIARAQLTTLFYIFDIFCQKNDPLFKILTFINNK